jgi:hypothetical protein
MLGLEPNKFVYSETPPETQQEHAAVTARPQRIGAIASLIGRPNGFIEPVRNPGHRV